MSATQHFSLSALWRARPSPRFARVTRIALPACVALLAGCANITSVAPGTPLSQVEQTYGQPTISCNRPGGGSRVVWSQQPSGSFAWGADIDAQGRIGRVESVLTDQHFNLLSQGTWTPERVRCEFGPPYLIGPIGLGDKREVVWSYRYMQNVRWHSVMSIYMGPDGDRVTHFHSGPDERYQRSE